MSPAELELHRRNTREFIRWDPVEISLVPTTTERTPAGGTKTVADYPRFPQTFRLLPQSGSARPPLVNTQDGKQREAEYVLLGEHDAEMAIGDEWLADDGRRWRVADVVRSNGYESRGLVTERGR